MSFEVNAVWGKNRCLILNLAGRELVAGLSTVSVVAGIIKTGNERIT